MRTTPLSRQLSPGIACRATRWPPHRMATSGFTLVEVLVAMMIMSIMAVMSWQGVDGIVRARDASQERLERQLRLNTVLAQWEQDLSAIQDSGAVEPLSFDGSTLRLTRTTPTGMQVVAWSLRGTSWLRWASPAVTTASQLQESWLRTQQLLGNEAGQLRLLGGASQWQIYFYRGNAWTNAQSSGDVVDTPTGGNASGGATPTPTPPARTNATGTGNPTATGGAPLAKPRTQLPAAVRLVMTFNGEGLAGSLTRDIQLGPQP